MLSVGIATNIAISAIELDKSFNQVLRRVQDALVNLPYYSRADTLNARLFYSLAALAGRDDRVELSDNLDKALGFDLFVQISLDNEMVFAVRADSHGRPARLQQWDFTKFFGLADFNEGWVDAD